jgi:cysteine desulfurase
MKKNIYLDYAATTLLDLQVQSVMQEYREDHFANASSKHLSGYKASLAVKKARSKVANVLNCQPNEIIFTSGGTESNNLALKGAAEACSFKGHIITSAIEHHSVLETANYLEKRGVKVTIIDVDEQGIVNPNHIKKAIQDDTFLVSIMYANNEIGSIQKINKIGKLVQSKDILMHADAVQAPGLLPLNVNKLHVDMFSISSHKFYGPKGVGVLYAKKETKLAAQMHGGGQEKGLRSGTENVPGIVGLAEALDRANNNQDCEVLRLSKLSDWLINEIKHKIPNAVLTGHPKERLANNISFCFPSAEGESLVMRLSERGFEISSGSACATGDLVPSHVLLACGIDKNTAKGSLRVTLGKSTTKRDLEKFAQVLAEEVEKLN